MHVRINNINHGFCFFFFKASHILFYWLNSLTFLFFLFFNRFFLLVCHIPSNIHEHIKTDIVVIIIKTFPLYNLWLSLKKYSSYPCIKLITESSELWYLIYESIESPSAQVSTSISVLLRWRRGRGNRILKQGCIFSWKAMFSQTLEIIMQSGKIIF